jgi:hypothetical protein
MFSSRQNDTPFLNGLAGNKMVNLIIIPCKISLKIATMVMLHLSNISKVYHACSNKEMVFMNCCNLLARLFLVTCKRKANIPKMSVVKGNKLHNMDILTQTLPSKIRRSQTFACR